MRLRTVAKTGRRMQISNTLMASPRRPRVGPRRSRRGTVAQALLARRHDSRRLQALQDLDLSGLALAEPDLGLDGLAVLDPVDERSAPRGTMALSGTRTTFCLRRPLQDDAREQAGPQHAVGIGQAGADASARPLTSTIGSMA